MLVRYIGLISLNLDLTPGACRVQANILDGCWQLYRLTFAINSAGIGTRGTGPM